MDAVRNPVLAGTWYPADAGELARQVDAYLEDGRLAGAPAVDRPAGRPLLAVVPHAGYAYSGPTAGRLYALLRDLRPRRVIILAPNHRRPLQRPALSSAAAFRTPLGDVAVDAAAVARLAADGAFAVDDAAHRAEHAVEIQLPFLQRLWPGGGFGIVPALVPAHPAHAAGGAAAAARALGAVVDERTLLLVSSDFTHYGASYGYVPFTRDVPARIERLDSGAILRILSGDAAGLRAYGHETGITMCGLEAAALALDCGLPAGHEAALVDYRRSGDRDGDYSLSVSYAAILVCSGAGDPPAPDAKGAP